MLLHDLWEKRMQKNWNWSKKAQEYIAEITFVVSVLEDLQKQPWHGTKEPSLGAPAWAGGWTIRHLEVPSNSNHSEILWKLC